MKEIDSTVVGSRSTDTVAKQLHDEQGPCDKTNVYSISNVLQANIQREQSVLALANRHDTLTFEQETHNRNIHIAHWAGAIVAFFLTTGGLRITFNRHDS